MIEEIKEWLEIKLGVFIEAKKKQINNLKRCVESSTLFIIFKKYIFFISHLV